MSANPADIGGIEAAVLGALIAGGRETVSQAIESGLSQPVFFDLRHQTIFAAIQELSERGLVPDEDVLFRELSSNGRLDAVGGALYLSRLTDRLPDVANVGHYIGILLESRHNALVSAAARQVAERPGDQEQRDQLLALLTAQRAGGGFDIVSYGDMVRADIPPREPLLVPWLSERELGMVYAPKGVGKTWFSLSVSVAISTGTAFMSWYAPKPCKTVYVDGEMDTDDTRRRVASIARGNPAVMNRTDLLSENLLLLSRDWLASKKVRLGYFTDPDVRARFLASIPKDTKFVVFDNLSCLFGGEENDAAAWDDTLDLLLELKHRGITVLLVHHSGKGGDQRGTSRREDSLNVCIRLESMVPDGELVSDGSKFRTVWAKTRSFTRSEAPSLCVELALDKERMRAVWLYETATDARTKLVIDAANSIIEDGAKPTVRAIADALQGDGLKMSRATIGRLMKSAKTAGFWRDDVAIERETKPPFTGPLSHVRQGVETEGIWRGFVSQLKPVNKQVDGFVSNVSSVSETAETTGLVSLSHTLYRGETVRQGACDREPGSDDGEE